VSHVDFSKEMILITDIPITRLRSRAGNIINIIKLP